MTNLLVVLIGTIAIFSKNVWCETPITMYECKMCDNEHGDGGGKCDGTYVRAHSETVTCEGQSCSVTAYVRYTATGHKQYTMRTCSPEEPHGTRFTSVGEHECYENEKFLPDYHAITCYCKANRCNVFKPPNLSEAAQKLIRGKSSCFTPSSLATLMGLLVTTLHQLLAVQRLL